MGEVQPMKEMFESYRIRAQPPQPVESACKEWPGHSRGRERESYPIHSVFGIPRKIPVTDPFTWEDKRKRHAYRFHDKEMRHGKRAFRNERYVGEAGYGGKWDCAAQWWVTDPEQVTCHGRLLSSRVTDKHNTKIPHSTNSEVYAGLPPRSRGKRSSGSVSDAFSDAPVYTSHFQSGTSTPRSSTSKDEKMKSKFQPPPRQSSASGRSERSSRAQSEASLTSSRQGSVTPRDSRRQGSVTSRDSRRDSRPASVVSGSQSARSESRCSERSVSRDYAKPSKESGASRGSRSTTSGSQRSMSERGSSVSSRSSRSSSCLTVSTAARTPIIEKRVHPATPAGARSMIEQLWQ